MRRLSNCADTMIPDDVKDKILPALAAPGEDVPRVTLPCGLALKFTVNEEVVTWAEFRRWRVALPAAGEIAGRNAFSYLQWDEAEAGVFENGDSCWQELVLTPAPFVEHNAVAGRPLVYIVSEEKAILTGSECAAGRERIRQAMRGGLAACPMALNTDRKTWSRFTVHDATVLDLPRVTITNTAVGEGRYVRQASEPGHYGHVILEIAPYHGTHDFLFVWAVGEDTIPGEFREAVWEGIQSFALEYFRETGPLTGVQVTVTGGSCHAVDSKAVSYKIAATMAFKNAVMQMTPTALAERREEITAVDAKRPSWSSALR